MTEYGRTDEQLADIPTAFRADYLKDHTVIITGAGTGLGRGMAHWVARLGARVVICGRNPDRLESTRQAIARYGGDVFVHAMTIRDPEAVDALFDAAWKCFGAPHLLINNAGGQFPSRAIDISAKGWNAVIDTNLTGTWNMMQAAARRWQDARVGGSIVNIVAVVGRGMPGVAHTAAARSGVIALSKTVAIEWAPLGIRVNCVAPGLISTEGMNVYAPETVAAMVQTNVMKRFGKIEEIADAACFVGGPAGAFMTGEVVHVDGGNQIWGDQWTIPRPEYFKADEK
jgi:citronellol/citronellal dehydrogenase